MMVQITKENLKKDVQRRVKGLQEILKEKDLCAAILPAAGAPGMNGLLRYFTNAELWAGKAFVIVTPDDPEPLIIYWSNYAAAWGEEMATTSRIESTIMTDYTPIDRVCEVVKEVADSSKRVGLANRDVTFLFQEWMDLKDGLEEFEIVDITDDVNEIRVIKSAFEIAVMDNLGRIMAEAFDIYEQNLKPGVRAWEVAAMAEAHIKGQGGYWGRQKYSLDERPYTIPTALDRRLQKDDIILFELVYAGPYGYWCEMTSVFSFGDLPAETKRRLDTTELAIQESAKAAVPGAHKGIVGEVSDRVFTEAGYKVIGAHTRHCHTIGTDEVDLRAPLPPEAELRENMVLSYHPATLLDGDLAFLISDNFVVTKEGAIPLSPRGKPHRIIQ